MGDCARHSRLQGVVDGIRTLTRYAVPFRYENNSLHRQGTPTTLSNRSWRETFGVEGGCLDIGSAGVRIQVPRIQGRRNNSRKLVVRLPSELPIEESDKHTVASPAVEVKQKHFNENDKMVVELPVVTKVKEDAESQSKAEFVVMRQNGQGKPIEEVPKSDWTHCPETSQLRIEVKRPSIKSIFFAIIRCIEGKIWKYIQITVHLSVYGPPYLEPSMCLHAIFSCRSRNSEPPESCDVITKWTNYQFQISRHQDINLKVDISDSRSGERLWKVEHLKVDPIHKEDMRGKQMYIESTVPVTFDPGIKQQQMEQFTLTLKMVATEDHREHHHSCRSPKPRQPDSQHVKTASLAISSGPSIQPNLLKKKEGLLHKKDRDQHHGAYKRCHSSCPVSRPEIPICSLAVVQASEDFAKTEDETRENLLNLQKGEHALILVPSGFKADRQGRSLHWDIGINKNGEIGYYPNEQVRRIKDNQTELKCTSHDILSYVRQLCSFQHLQIDDDSIKMTLANELCTKWRELARVLKFTSCDIDAIATEAGNDEKEAVIRFAEKIKMERGCRGYLPALVCGLLAIGLRKLAVAIVVNTLLYTVTKTTIGRWEDFEKELVVLSTRKNLKLSVRKVAGAEDINNALWVLKRGYCDNNVLFLECLKIALRDRKWKDSGFTECEILTEKVLIFQLICHHLCSCNLEDRQIY